MPAVAPLLSSAAQEGALSVEVQTNTVSLKVRHTPSRPALWIALAFGTGIALHAYASLFPEAYAAAAILLALCAIVCRYRHRAAIILLAASLLLAGLAWAQVQRFCAAPQAILHRIGAEPCLLRVRAVITDQPAMREGIIRGTLSLAARARLLAIEDNGQWQPSAGDLLLRIEPAGPLQLSPGQEITAIGELSRILPPANPGEYDWRAHFARENIHLRLSVNHWETVKAPTIAKPSLLWRARAAAREALASGFRQDETRALAMALLLGDSSDSLEQAWSDFRVSGTAHHLSISGTHIAILTLFVFVIGRCLMLHPRTVLIGALLFAVLYAGLVRPSPPVVRSVLLCLAVTLAILLRRNTDPVQCLFVAVLAMLLYSPMDLTSPGFQLSFGAVAALMLFTGRLLGWYWSLENEHDRMARTIRPPRGFAALRHWAHHWIVSALAAGLVAYCVSMPLVAIHFRQINPWAVPGSLILSPLVVAALATGLGKMAICAVIPSAAGLLAVPAETSVAAMRWCVGLLADLPGAQIGVRAVAPWMIVIYSVLILSPLIRPLRAWRFRWTLPLAAVLLFTFAPFLPRSATAPSRSPF